MSFLPDNFVVPRVLATSRVRLRPLLVTDAEKDFDAVMSSRAHLWEMFGAHWGWRWAFYIVVPPGLLLGILSLLMRDPPKASSTE